jgi:hypothetical protein
VLKKATVILEWAFTPSNYLEEPIEIHETAYWMTIADGKAEARIDAEIFDRDPYIRVALHDRVDDQAHLYEIRDALRVKFGNEHAVRAKLGITCSELAEFRRIANNEPLRQGRHRGKNAGKLRDATEDELQEARRVARKMIEAYLKTL